jgi:glycerophosphoryl diester phosphodiesterase
MAAFEASIHAGAQMIELDVTLSRDGEVVVIHDSTVDRTSNGSGQVVRFTLKELKALDAGSWYHANFAGERIPTLEEVLDAFGRKVLINIEVKAGEADSESSLEWIGRKIVKMIRKRHLNDSVLISSFDFIVLEHLLRVKESSAKALLCDDIPDNAWLERCKELQAFSFHPRFELLSEEAVEQWHSAGIFVFPWNVRSDADIDACYKLGVDGLFVDDPVMAKKRLSLI